LEEQATFEASLEHHQIVHIEWARAEFQKAKFGTVFSITKEDGTFHMGRVNGEPKEAKEDYISFYALIEYGAPELPQALDKRFLLSVTQIGHPGTREHEALSAQFTTQQF
ncbi:hypothetical protein ACFL22_00500, partial [Patescibacteria group bacterium]